ncbi:MAG TPA: helix-turn-helix domain-containing protein [Ktedonobacteraceae bacterium]|nr:helix-turn-helix domain-containing protein [Ktedonobacteraceae bacterium]
MLDAAAELVQRWGYKKTTIEDIARQADVGKGTIYLHWKTREELFIALLLRERLRAINEAEEHLARDPEGASLHAAVKQSTLAMLTNPLLRAAIQQDTPLWSELMRTRFVLADTANRLAAGRLDLEHLRAQGQVRDDESLDDQVMMLGAISTGFMVLNSYLPEEQRLSVEALVTLLATVVARTFEIQASSETPSEEKLSPFHDLFEQARALSQKPVE